MTLSPHLLDARARILEDVREQLPEERKRVRLVMLAHEPLPGREDAVVLARDENDPDHVRMIVNPIAVIDLLEAIDDTRQVLAALAQLTYHDDDLVRMLASRACSTRLSTIAPSRESLPVDEIDALLQEREASCRTADQDHRLLTRKPLR